MKINEYRHSASKGNDWYGNPSLWIYRNLLGKRSETTPRMAMVTQQNLVVLSIYSITDQMLM